MKARTKRIIRGNYVCITALAGYMLELSDQPGVLRPEVEILLTEEYKVKVVEVAE